MKFVKKNQLSSELLIIDGMWGVGKSIITNLLSAFDRMECWRMDFSFDYIPQLYGEGSITEDAATSLLVNIFDGITRDMSISRSVNFRFKDATSVLKHPKKYDYILRMFKNDTNISYKEICEDGMIIPIATHLALSNNDLFLRALGKRCKIIRCVRNPLFMVEHWADYIGRCKADPMEFTLKIKHNMANVPFFAEGWEDEYLKSNNFEKSIESIARLTERYDNSFHFMKKKYGKESILEVSYEDSVKDTDRIMNLISKFIGSDINYKNYKKAKKKERVPRLSIYSGPGYASQNWKKPAENMSDKNIIKKKLDFLKNKVRPEYYNKLLSLISDYEKK
jgi:hypothetical protein